MEDQVTVPLLPEQRAFLEKRAAHEDRPMASVVRRLIAEAMRADGGEPSEASRAIEEPR